MGNDAFFIENVNKTIEKHLNYHGLKGNFIAQEIGINRMQLHRKLKRITGQNAEIYILNRRIISAKQELIQTSKFIYQIAKSCGFKDYTYFSKCFKKQVGLSPSEFRKQKGI
jgi:AraC-like DNA-binding protein